MWAVVPLEVQPSADRLGRLCGADDTHGFLRGGDARTCAGRRVADADGWERCIGDRAFWERQRAMSDEPNVSEDAACERHARHHRTHAVRAQREHRVWVGVGSSHETARNCAASAICIEHMLFKGTPSRTAREIAEFMDSVGGNLNAFTDKETTCYHARVVDASLERDPGPARRHVPQRHVRPGRTAQRAASHSRRDPHVRRLTRRNRPRLVHPFGVGRQLRSASRRSATTRR